VTRKAFRIKKRGKETWGWRKFYKGELRVCVYYCSWR